MPSRVARTSLLALVAGCALALGPAAPAQTPPAAAPAGTVPQTAPNREAQVGQDHLARTLARIALTDLRAATSPDDEDYRLAALLLGMARELLPDDMDLLRRQADAAFNAGDEAQALDLFREALRRDPSDTVLQLRLISAGIGRAAQTVEDRLERLRRAVADTRIDASVRSRLALDAALLLRERGDDRGYLDLLRTATTLDSTHKEAASLTAFYVLDRLASPADRVDALANLLLADPIDANVHLTLSRELALGGAWESSRRFYDVAMRLYAAAGERYTPAAVESRVLIWHVEGPAAVVSSINREIDSAKADAIREIRRLEDNKLPTDKAVKPEDITFPIDAALLYILAAVDAGELTAARSTLGAIEAEVIKQARRLQDPLTRGADVNDEQARFGISNLLVLVHTVRMATGLAQESARADLERAEPVRLFQPEMFDLLSSLCMVHEGKAEDAVERLRGHGGTPLAEFGLGLALERAGRAQEAIEQYRRTLKLFPFDPFGASARTRARALGYQEDPAASAAARRAAAAIPTWVDRLAVTPADFVAITATVEGGQEVIDGARLRIALTNLAPRELALGADRALGSRLLLAPAFETRGVGLDAFLSPEVVDLDRRLRLRPRERVEIEFRPELGPSGWVVESLANRSVRTRWRIVQSPMPDGRGGFYPGPFAITTTTPSLIQRPLPEAMIAPPDLAARVAGDPEVTLYRLGVIARALTLQPLLAPRLPAKDRELAGTASPTAGMFLSARRTDNAEQETRSTSAYAAEGDALKPFAEAMAARYPTLSARTRAHVLAVTPSRTLAPAMAALDAAAAAEAEPLPLTIAIITRVNDPADPLLERARSSGDERLRAIADAHARRLSRDEAITAKFSPEMLAQIQEAERRRADGGPAPEAAPAPAPAADPAAPPGVPAPGAPGGP